MTEKQLLEKFVAWLTTQQNRNGSLYLENVARCYARYLQTAPPKLNLPLNEKDRSVYGYRTLEEFLLLCKTFRTAPNYKSVDYASSHNSFSAGLRCYERYMEYLSVKGEPQNKYYGDETMEERDVAVTENKPQLNMRNTLDFSEMRKYTGTRPTECVINGEQITKQQPNDMHDAKTLDDKAVAIAIDTILAEKFANGFRYTSEIEIGRLRKFANNLLNYEMNLPDDNIVSYVKSKGTECDGKVYVVSADTKERIKKLAEDYFEDGASAIFYDAFYKKHEHWLFEASVMSEEMLTNILCSAFPKMKFTQTYFGRTDKRVYDVLESEVLRVWGSDFLLNYDMLAERLTYIPIKRIEYVLGQNNDFIWNSKREFTHLSLIDITEDDKVAIRRFVEEEIEAHEYVSISDIPLGGISERNIELSLTAIHNAIFRSCLEGSYDRRGKIITHNGGNIDAKHIMDEYCRSLDRCTLDDLLGFEKELTGECHRWIPMQAGYDIMVRTTKNDFVAERHLSFDRSVIDNAIEHFMNGGEYITLKTVSTFAPFSYCGQAWNLFLLESYCRRFSESFRFEVLSVNSNNAGAIVRKHSKMTYAGIMADAVAKSGTVLDERTVIEFLHKEGFIAKRRYTQTAELIRRAKVLRG